MKYTYIALSALSATAAFLTAMDQPHELVPVYRTQKNNIPTTTNTIITTNTTSSEFTKLVEQLKQNINEEQHKNPQNSYMLGKCVHMSKENAINIANKIAAYNLDTQFIKRMIQENDFCKMAFDKLEKYANEEIASVTISSVDDIINYNRLQGIWQKLPLDTTYYVLRQVLNNLQFSYNIELSGHSADILCAQICEKTDTAAVGCQNKIVYLYNLENAVCTQLLQTSTIPNIICFNTDGSQVAIAAETSDYNIPTITIWCPHTGQQLFQIKMPQNKIYNISYTDNKDHKNQLHVISSRKDIFNSCMQITTCSLNKGKESNKGSSNVPCTIPAQLTNRPSKITLTRYIIYMPILLFDLKTKLLIKNYYCPPLSLCLTALKNTQNADDLTNIRQTSVYKDKLTAYEQSLVEKEIDKRRNGS